MEQTDLKGNAVTPWKGVCCKACYYAKGKRCTCKCGGAYHGLGRRTEESNRKEGEVKKHG